MFFINPLNTFNKKKTHETSFLNAKIKYLKERIPRYGTIASTEFYSVNLRFGQSTFTKLYF